MLSNSIKDKIEADYIASGVCKPGDKLPTIRKLVKEYGVSYVTVIEAIRILSQENKVVKRQGSGVYVPSGGVRSDRKTTTKKIGYITNCFSQKNTFGYEILAGIERLAYLNGYKLEVANSTYVHAREKESVADMVKNGVDGIILYPVPGRNREHEYLAEEFLDVPIVTVDLVQPEMQRPSVVFDNHNAAYEMGNYLIKKGCSRIVFLHHVLDIDNRSIQDRIAGSMKAVELESPPCGNKLSFSIENWEGENSRCMYDKLKILMDSKNRPDGIIASNDSLAAHVYFWLTSNGYGVPSEIELVGFDNVIPESVPWHDSRDGYQYHWPTTNPDFMRLGERAVELLLKTIESDSNVVSEIVLPCPILVERNNVAQDYVPVSRIKVMD